MISAKEATDIIAANSKGWGTECIDIKTCSGRVLMEDILADRDFPPFHRVTMDGIAIRSEDFQKGCREFEIEEMQQAGAQQKALNRPNCAHEIMTGAVLSKGADAVIRYEDLGLRERNGKKYARVNIREVLAWKNVHLKGSDKQSGAVLLKAGNVLSAADVAILASVGQQKVKVSKLPKVAIISTGDELVEVNQTPEPHQIRMSNSVMIETKLNELGIENGRFHLPDDYQKLKEKIGEILNAFDVLLLSGGVSKGKADFVPQVLQELGVQKLFHRVAQRPGKPFWFGKSNEGKVVFALPGNPISTFMCFVVYFLPWLGFSAGRSKTENAYAQLSEDCTFKPELTYFLQVSCTVSSEGNVVAAPQEGGGSGDLSNLSKSGGFLELPFDRFDFKKGESFRVYLYRDF